MFLIVSKLHENRNHCLFTDLFPKSHKHSVNMCLEVEGGRSGWKKGAEQGEEVKENRKEKKKCQLLVTQDLTIQWNISQAFWFYTGTLPHDLIRVLFIHERNYKFCSRSHLPSICLLSPATSVSITVDSEEKISSRVYGISVSRSNNPKI